MVVLREAPWKKSGCPSTHAYLLLFVRGEWRRGLVVEWWEWFPEFFYMCSASLPTIACVFS